MSTSTTCVRPEVGADATDHLILRRVDRAVRVGERELRYQLEHKDEHSLAQADELLDVLVQLEAEGLVESEWTFRLTARGRERLAWPGRQHSGGGVCVMSVPVLSAGVRVLAGVLAGLFDRDRELAGVMNAAQRRLLGANEQVKAATEGSAGRELANTIRGAFVAYQIAAEDRRGLGADVGEAVVRLVDAMAAAGYSEQQARNADVWALRDGIYRPRGAS